MVPRTSYPVPDFLRDVSLKKSGSLNPATRQLSVDPPPGGVGKGSAAARRLLQTGVFLLAEWLGLADLLFVDRNWHPW
jgi:hypothetical protein